MLEQFQRLVETHAFDGLGLVVAMIAIGLAWVLLPLSERPRLRLPIGLVALHLVLVAVALIPGAELFSGPLRVGALSSVLLATGRAFFLVIHGVSLRNGGPLPRILQDILQGGIYVVVVLSILRAAGADPGSLLTGSALVTAVIGLSLQETLGNVFAGLAIQAQQPFEVGNWIQFEADPTSIGQVVEINWRATRLLTLDNVEITVPNGALARASLRNYSRPDPRLRRTVVITAPAELPPAEAKSLMVAAVVGMEGVLDEPAPDAQTAAFTDRGVEYKIRYWTTDLARRDQLDGLVRDRLWYALDRAGHVIPGATRKVYLHETNETARAAKRASAADYRLRVLRRIDIFAALPEEVLRGVAASCERRHFAPGEIVIREGDKGEELFAIERGDVEVLVRQGEEEAVVAQLSRGAVFGEMSLMTGEHRRATVRARGATVVLAVGKNALAPVLAESPELAERISEVLAARRQDLGRVSFEGHAQGATGQESELILDRIRRFFRIT